MKVLWFTNAPLPEMKQFLGHGSGGASGHWMTELLHHVAGRRDIKLGVVTACPDSKSAVFEVDDVSYFVVPQPRRLNAFAMRDSDLEKCAQIVESFGPDLVHVHGSERFYGLLRASGRIRVPMLVSMQGLMNPYSKFRNFFGALSVMDILRSTRLLELPLRIGLLWQYFYTRRGARREAEILKSADAFLGRTSWDHAHIRFFNYAAPYFHVGEIMRQPFYHKQWNLEDCGRYSLLYTNAGHPRRGTEDILASIAFLRRQFPGVHLRLAGTLSERSGYARFVRNRIRELDLQDNVELLGYLDAESLSVELLRTHVFLLSSYIENSPNSLAEAMLVGVPCVASAVGGVSDMINNGKDGLLFPAGDVPLLAFQIGKIFQDDVLAAGLGANARLAALAAHDPETVTNQLLAAYDSFRSEDGN